MSTSYGPNNPCPACLSKPKMKMRCGSPNDGGVVVCANTTGYETVSGYSSSGERSSDGRGVKWYADDGASKPAGSRRVYTEGPKPGKEAKKFKDSDSFDRIRADATPILEPRYLFVNNLGLDISAYKAMAWWDCKTASGKGCFFTLPEYGLVDGKLEVVAMNVRYPDRTLPDGTKEKGGKPTYGNPQIPEGRRRGVFVPTDWHKKKGPVFLCEGASGTTAGASMGLKFLGRPNCDISVEDTILHLWRQAGLESECVPLVVLADYDPDPSKPGTGGDSYHFPGRRGARQCAAALAKATGQFVDIVFVPGPVAKGHPTLSERKDVRDYYFQNKHLGTPEEIGEKFLSELQVAERVYPEDFERYGKLQRAASPVPARGGDGASEVSLSAALDALCSLDEERHPLVNRVEIRVIDPAQLDAGRVANQIRQQVAERHRAEVAALSAAGMRREKCGCVPIALRDPSSGYGMRGRTRCKTWGCTCCALEYRKREFLWKGLDAMLYQTGRAGHGQLLFHRHDGPGGRLVMPDRPNAAPRMTHVYRLVVQTVDERKKQLRGLRGSGVSYGFATVKLCDRTIAIYSDHPRLGGEEMTTARAAQEWAEDVFNAPGKGSLTMGGTWQRPDSESNLERIHCSATVSQTVAKLEEIQASLPIGTSVKDGVWFDDREGHVGVNGILREVAWTFGSEVSAQVQSEFYAWLADGDLREELRQIEGCKITFCLSKEPEFENVFAGMT